MKPQQAKTKRKLRDSEGSIIKKEIEKRTTSGKIKKVTEYYARVRYTDRFGHRREKKRKALTFEDAKTVRRRLHEEIKAELNPISETAIKTFDQLANYFENEYVKEAEFSGDRKISGLREKLVNPKRQIKIFREHFGSIELSKITYEDLRRFKDKRLKRDVVVKTIVTRKCLNCNKPFSKLKARITDQKFCSQSCSRKYKGNRSIIPKQTETKEMRPRTLATVHRELARLRRMFNVAVKKKWMHSNPFADGDALISQASENIRVRILTADEEKRLIEQCTGQRAHLKAIVITAIDTFMRRGEIFKLRWQDVDFEKRVIKLHAKNTKTLRPRIVPISKRVLELLRDLRENTFDNKATDKVFGIVTHVQKSFRGACNDAEIYGVRFHDLRGTGITRMLRAGMPAAEVMKMSGHTTWSVFARYVRQDDERALEAAGMLDDWHDENL